MRTAEEAIEFVRAHGIVLEAARGRAPSFSDAVAGAVIKGNWWGHPQGKLIFRLTRAVRDSGDVLVCRLLDGKITYVHRRLWPALVRLAPQLDKEDLASLRDVHTATGAHTRVTTAFPEWVPEDVAAAARALSEGEARRQLEAILV
ncbi:MAG: hypothetical protein DI564_03825 [Rhodanobacter denitrificans]|uniref:Uncharacterized protein n=1 Tax=Rhodanobacter denitrificans TaxID=666685 RepID=A0A2W5KN08_9GAMM|nr:MAG: hypothetical protein DI564_03825 [Rhodanobacter denitrificans]